MTDIPFSAFGPSHLAVWLIFIIGSVVLVAAGRRLSSGGQYRLGRIMAVLIVMFQLPLQISSFLPAHWELGESLPFHFCDLTWMIGVWALWTHQRWAASVLYYWGLTMTTQAMITPDLERDFPSIQFVMFWGMHCLIVWSAIYITWGLKLRPDWHGYRITVALTVCWMILMLWFNTVFGTNYLYVNAKPVSASLLDFMGPWPVYVLLALSIYIGVWALITWPWTNPQIAPSRHNSH